MASAIHKMGGDNVYTNTLGIIYTDGTVQTTASTASATGGSTIAGDDTGLTLTDPFGNAIQTGLQTGGTAGNVTIKNPAGAVIGFNETTAEIFDAASDGLELGANGQHYNLSSGDESTGLWSIITRSEEH